MGRCVFRLANRTSYNGWSTERSKDAEEMVRECISNRRDAVGQENFIFLDDNARAHRAAVVMEALENLQINH